MHHRKLLTVAISLVIMLITLMSQETIAYYAVVGETVNVVTTGDVNISIIEKLGDNSFPEEGVYVLPGAVVAKKVSVKNTGTHPCWVRIKLTNGVDGDTLTPDVFEIDINEENWLDGKDGYYYYKNILQPDVETEKLFTQVKISGDTDAQYIGKTLKLIVTAYAVQSENMPASNPLEVVGWPEES